MRLLWKYKDSRALSAGWLCLVFLLSACGAQRASARTHLDWAEILVKELKPEDTSYQHKNGYVRWKGEGGAQAYESHTDCSGFLTVLLEKAYGLTQADFEKWLNTKRPLAVHYHDALVDQRRFRLIESVKDTQPGDIIAIKYPPDAENSGHIMLIAETPQRRRSSHPEREGTEQWEVTVIDASRSGHGKTDTRRTGDGTFGSGVGKGVFRIYVDKHGKPVGYTWSTFSNSEYYDQAARHLAIGRLDLAFR